MRLNESVREVHGGATVFIPANTWVSVNMRAESVREGEKALPLSREEDAEIIKKHAHAVIYNYEALP